MRFLDLNSDVLAIKCIENYIFIGIGCALYVLNSKNYNVKIKINVLHPDNVHGIIVKSDKLIVYGEKSLCILSFNINNNFITIEQVNEIHRFNDWIINAEWLGPLSDPILTILFAHNNVFNFEIYTKKYYNTYCMETCLLYSGAILGQTCKNAIIFSGTIFQEILIWRVTNSKYSKVLHRLIGHKGIIFSIFYNPSYNFICSTSDDRTVRLWKVSSNIISNQRTIVWENVTISLQTTMYGHLARVLKAVQFKNIIASIGEDSRICFWNLFGELIHKIEAHQGAPIWCIDISQEDLIFTGGGDGSVNSWPLNINSYLQHYILLKDNDVFPKYVSFIDNGDVLIYSNLNNSKILHFNKNFELLYSYVLPEYLSTYCIMEVSINRQCVALASIDGNITLYKRIGNILDNIGQYKIMESKIISIQWLEIDSILISIEKGLLYILKFSSKKIYIFSKLKLPPCRERWVTSACTYNNLLICGDRMGSIFIYNLQNDVKDPVQSFKKIHGRFGVQSCIIMNYNLITTGRDGAIKLYKFYGIDSKNVRVKFLHSKTMPMDWISRLLKNENEYYVLGFKEEDFIMYSLNLKRILIKIPCGGGHRSWDCMMFNKLINFVYIQKKQTNVITIPLKILLTPSLLTGFHTKQTYCIKILKTLSKSHHFLVSGSEDCALIISYINLKSQIKLKFVDSFNGHLSNIKCISIHTLLLNKNMSKHLIFSGGGRAQLKVWEITIKTNRHIFSNKDLCCKDLLSYMLHGLDKTKKKNWVGKELMYSKNSETRYMDISTIKNPHNVHSILVFIACSDGCLRSLNYNIKSNTIKLIDTLVYNQCILKVHSFNHKGNILLMTMATDGLLKLWNVALMKYTILITYITIDGNKDFSLHQCGINSFDFKVLNNYEYILATGGDDNLINLLTFKISLENKVLSVKIISLWKTASIHSAQITGIKLLNDNRLISVGADQKFAIHKYSYNNSEISVILLKEIKLCIPDVQGIALCENQM